MIKLKQTINETMVKRRFIEAIRNLSIFQKENLIVFQKDKGSNYGENYEYTICKGDDILMNINLYSEDYLGLDDIELEQYIPGIVGLRINISNLIINNIQGEDIKNKELTMHIMQEVEDTLKQVLKDKKQKLKKETTVRFPYSFADCGTESNRIMDLLVELRLLTVCEMDDHKVYVPSEYAIENGISRGYRVLNESTYPNEGRYGSSNGYYVSDEIYLTEVGIDTMVRALDYLDNLKPKKISKKKQYQILKFEDRIECVRNDKFINPKLVTQKLDEFVNMPITQLLYAGGTYYARETRELHNYIKEILEFQEYMPSTITYGEAAVALMNQVYEEDASFDNTMEILCKQFVGKGKEGSKNG